jgi:hypothetical protein
VEGRTSCCHRRCTYDNVVDEHAQNDDVHGYEVDGDGCHSSCAFLEVMYFSSSTVRSGRGWGQETSMRASFMVVGYEDDRMG